MKQWDDYDLQTEKMLVATGCVIYDAAVGSIALAVGGILSLVQITTASTVHVKLAKKISFLPFF